jgi:hypothetical protein
LQFKLPAPQANSTTICSQERNSIVNTSPCMSAAFVFFDVMGPQDAQHKIKVIVLSIKQFRCRPSCSIDQTWFFYFLYTKLPVPFQVVLCFIIVIWGGGLWALSKNLNQEYINNNNLAYKVNVFNVELMVAGRTAPGAQLLTPEIQFRPRFVIVETGGLWYCSLSSGYRTLLLFSWSVFKPRPLHMEFW